MTDPILKEREASWGEPVLTHTRIAKVWSGILNHPVTPSQVALCMAGLKLVRADLNSDDPDSYVDARAYVTIAADITGVGDQTVKIPYTGAEPTQGHAGDAGLDLTAAHSAEICPLQQATIELATRICLPQGTFAWLTLRSSLAAQGLQHHLGLIDAGYTGPLKLVVWNLGNQVIRIRAFERVAQLVPQTLPTVRLNQVDELPTTARNTGGFGSTGKDTQ